MKKYFAEFLGTFALVFAGCGAIVVDGTTGGTISHAGIALTFGLIVMSMIYALGDVSGAHINPAATVCFWWAGRFEGRQAGPYIAAQCLGAITAAGILRILFPDHQTLGATLPSGTWWQSFVLEVLLTWLLMFVVLNVSTGSKERHHGGRRRLAMLSRWKQCSAGPICGASMNPARSLGPAAGQRADSVPVGLCTAPARFDSVVFSAARSGRLLLRSAGTEVRQGFRAPRMARTT